MPIGATPSGKHVGGSCWNSFHDATARAPAGCPGRVLPCRRDIEPRDGPARAGLRGLRALLDVTRVGADHERPRPVGVGLS